MSPIYADGKLYFSSKQGDVSVIVATRTEPESQQNDAQFIASPADSGSSLILRSTTHLYCIADGYQRSKEGVANEMKQQTSTIANKTNFWEMIEACPLPEGYHGARHQAFVDRQIAKMTPEQLGRLGELWRNKQQVDPNMTTDTGASFVKIMMFVCESEKLPH